MKNLKVLFFLLINFCFTNIAFSQKLSPKKEQKVQEMISKIKEKICEKRLLQLQYPDDHHERPLVGRGIGCVNYAYRCDKRGYHNGWEFWLDQYSKDEFFIATFSMVKTGAIVFIVDTIKKTINFRGIREGYYGKNDNYVCHSVYSIKDIRLVKRLLKSFETSQICFLSKEVETFRLCESKVLKTSLWRFFCAGGENLPRLNFCRHKNLSGHRLATSQACAV